MIDLFKTLDLTMDEEITLDPIRAKTRAAMYPDGVICPCCDRGSKIYKRKILGVAVYGLIVLVKIYIDNPGWVHFNKVGPRVVIQNGGSFAHLKHWGLIAEKLNPDDPTKRCSGFWKPTEKGIHFAQNRIGVPEYVYTLNKKKLQEEGFIRVKDALGVKFNYNELMQNYMDIEIA